MAYYVVEMFSSSNPGELITEEHFSLLSEAKQFLKEVLNYKENKDKFAIVSVVKPQVVSVIFSSGAKKEIKGD
jgi:hypothetical protein